MGSLNIHGVYGDVSKELDTEKFCIQQDISIESNKDFKALLWYMLGVNGWTKDREEKVYNGWRLLDFLNTPTAIKDSRLRTKSKTVDKEGYIHGGVYLNSLYTPKLIHGISSILTRRELLLGRDRMKLLNQLPYEAIIMYNEIQNIHSKIYSIYDRSSKDSFINYGDFKESKFYTKKELEAFQRYQVPRLELNPNGTLVAISPDGIIMSINDVEEPDMLLSLIFFFNRGYSYLDKKKMFAIVVPKRFRYTEFLVKGNKVDGEVHFLTIATTIKNNYLLQNVTLIYDEDIEMIQK